MMQTSGRRCMTNCALNSHVIHDFEDGCHLLPVVGIDRCLHLRYLWLNICYTILHEVHLVSPITDLTINLWDAFFDVFLSIFDIFNDRPFDHCQSSLPIVELIIRALLCFDGKQESILSSSGYRFRLHNVDGVGQEAYLLDEGSLILWLADTIIGVTHDSDQHV